MATAFEHIVKHTKPAKVQMMREGKVGARLATYADGLQAIMKPQEEVSAKKGKPRQSGIPIRRIPQNEVAFYQLAKLLHFTDVVPETVLGDHEGNLASFQEYVHSKRLYEIQPAMRSNTV